MHRLTLTAICLNLALPATAEQLSYRPVNPSFGGNALNSNHLMAIANAQRTATASDAAPTARGSAGTGSRGTTTDADRFVSQLQSRLYSALSSQVAEAIFGANPQDSGQVTFGDTRIQFDRTNGAINLTISDFATGTVTQIVVPELVTN